MLAGTFIFPPSHKTTFSIVTVLFYLSDFICVPSRILHGIFSRLLVSELLNSISYVL